MDFGTFAVTQVILHKIPKVARNDKASSRPEFAEAPSPLDDGKRNFFREQIVKSLTRRSLPVVYDDANGPESPVPDAVVEFFVGNGANFVEASRQMAQHLYDLQGGNSPEGALALVDGTIGLGGKNTGRCVVVMKLEMDSALVLTQSTTNDGKATYDVDLTQVTLNEKARVFKACVFERSNDLASIKALASDTQAGDARYDADVADFFLRFLGCKPRDAADRATLDFKEKTEGLINSLVSDDETKWNLERALMAELANNKAVIDPKQFIKDNVPTPDLRDEFLNAFKTEDGSVPIIQKETTLVADALTRRVIKFENGLRLEGQAEAVDAAVTVRDGKTTISAGVRSVAAKR